MRCRPAYHRTGEPVEHDQLSAAHPSAGRSPSDLVTPGLELGQYCLVDTGFDGHVQPALVIDPRDLDSLLRVHAEFDDVQEDLHVLLGLYGSAHGPERHEELAVFERHRRDDRVEGALVRLDDIDVAGLP